jgi:GMP synthase (glutamine-hydrolysing)
MTAERSWVAIQHVPFEGPGLIAEVASLRGLELRPCHPYRGDPLPAMDEIDGLVVMGGPMGVFDTAEHPYLAREVELIAAVVEAGRPVLGVCLGAQLMARALGAAVYRGGQAEIGFGSVSLTEAGREDPVLSSVDREDAGNVGRKDAVPGSPGLETVPVVHWHQDTFDLPFGALCLARSALYPHQAFRVGERAYGLQFHVEVNRQLADAWREHLPIGVTLPEWSLAQTEAVGRKALEAFFGLADA